MNGGSHRGSNAVAAAGTVAPLAVSFLAMLTSAPAAVSAPPEPPARAGPAIAGPAVAGGIELPPPARDFIPPGCMDRYQLARPVQRGEDAAARETLICRRGYLLAYNADMRNPDWVMEHLTTTEVTGTARRSNRFLHDPALPAGADAISADFSPPGNMPHYDRGHQAPAGDSSFDQRIQDESFYFTNMSPQVGLGFNRAAWRILEENVRRWVLCGHPDVYVITGPIYGNNPATTGANRVAVPIQYFKIVYDVTDGYAVGFVMPNQAIGSRPVLQDYVWPIADIETATGLDFFSGFDQRRQAMLESDRGTAWGHTGGCSGGG